jgi:predicted metal-dependent enzyme (double-stranded beta helix superfamily)
VRTLSSPPPALAEIAARLQRERADAELGPIASTVLFENARVRVWEMRLAPGEVSPLHHHENDYVIVLLEGDRIAAVPGPGSSRAPREAEVTPGRTVCLSAGDTEWAVNTGRLPYREILIELLPPAPARP